MRAYPRIQADALDDSLRVQALHLRIGVQFVEVTHPQGQVGVGEQFHRFRLRGAHEQHRNVLLQRPLLDDRGEGVSGLR